MTDVELDARVTALEENSGDGNSLNGKTTDLFSIIYREKLHEHEII